MSENSIVYQNKDVISKVLAESLMGKSLKVYGVDIPKIIKVLPTNLPEVSANELRLDNLFLLEDGSIAIIDYESEFKLINRNKYMDYIARVLKRYELEGIYDLNIRLIVIYTGDVQRKSVKTEYDMGAAKLSVEGAFLSELDSEKIRNRITSKVNSGESLTDEEIMEFIILPLTYKNKSDKQASIKESVELAKKIKDEKVMTTVLAGILVFTDKVIDEELGNKVKEWLMMTKVARLFEKEKEIALAEKDAEIAEKDAALAEKDAVIAKLVADKDVDLAKKNSDLAEKDLRIKELEARLKKLEA